MDSQRVDVFWSYTHDDDDRSGGRVTGVAEALKNEFSLVTGDELEVFRDRSSLKWGDAWRERIEAAVGEAPFFIPIITPKFLRSQECRRELIQFSGLAKSRGFNGLLLPILYIDVPGMAEDAEDEVLALIARTQYFNWTAFRLLAPDDPQVLQAVNDLALRIRELRGQITESVLVRESATDEDEVNALKTVIAEIDVRLEKWREAVDFDRIAGANWQTYLKERLARVRRLRDSRAAESAVFSTYVQLGKDLLPIAQDRLVKAQAYARLSIELDPLIDRAIGLVDNHRELSPWLNALRDGVNEAYLNIEFVPGDESGFQIPAALVDANKHLAEAVQAVKSCHVFVSEGNDLVVAWREKLRELDAQSVVVVR
jgi:hypothetical protein